MKTEIVVALIGAGGVVLAAVIGGIFALLKKDGSVKETKINQKQGIGNQGTQIGIQNNYNKQGDEDNE